MDLVETSSLIKAALPQCSLGSGHGCLAFCITEFLQLLS
jgi:hypothetical protein